MKKEDIKKSVHFTQPQQNESVPVKENVVKYMSMQACRLFVTQGINSCMTKLKLFTQNDLQIKRKDTALGLITILENLKFSLMHLNLGTFEDKQQNYHLAYNGTIMILDICQLLRQSQFSSQTVDYLGFAICTLESHLILQNIKFLEWRIKLYVELAHVYEEIGSNEVALRTIELAIKKTNEIQIILEQDPPLPTQTIKVFENVFRILRSLEIKYKLQTNQLQSDLFKKKLDEYFPVDKEGRAVAIIESLRFRVSNIIEQNGKTLAWKDLAVKQAYDILKGDIEIIVNYIKQELANIEKQPQNELNEEKRIKMFQDNINAVKIEKNRFKEAQKSIPLEYHIELCMHAYDVGNMTIFEDLSLNALFRSKYRRIEVQYITEIKIVVSSHPNPNIDNEFEIIPQDINEAQLKILMKKHKIFKDDGPQQKQDDQKGKDIKKGGKDAKDVKDVKAEDKDTKVQEAIPGLKHLYTYILIKRSISPQNAICGFKVLLAPEDDQNSAELKPLLDAGWKVIECPVQQYTGVRETQKKAVYICYKCTSENLKDEEEKKNLLLDIKPVFSKSPLARPDFGYQIIDIDLRQVPYEFIKHPDNDYLYITYKSNQDFYSNERMLKLIMQLNELEKTYGKDKAQNIFELRQLELDINYDINKLQQLFQTIKESLEGPLGVQFYEERKEFLTKLLFLLWKKYMTSQIYQIESIQDMALQKEITQEELIQYYEHIDPVKNIFKLGLKMINLVLNRDASRSLIWFIKSTMELTKILMQDEETHEAAQFLKSCYDLVVIYRDEQLNRGVETRKDLFLPYSITANNTQIGTLVKQIIDSYVQQKNVIENKIREKARERDFKTLSVDEQQEELQENLDYKKLFNNDDNRDKAYFEHLDQENFISQLDLLINALQVDLVMCYYRCSIKEGKKLKKIQKISSKNNGGFNSQSMTKKLEMNKGKSYQDTKQKLNTLQNDLQNAGRLPVPQPQIQDYEIRLKNHANKNPYLLALLNMLMACNKKQFAEQKYLLNQAFDQIQKAQEMEKQLMQQAVNDAIYICSSLLDNKILDQKSNQFHPFDRLYQYDYIPEAEQPRQPIYLSRTSSSLTLKLPPFNPKLSEQESSTNPGIKDIRSMVLYGKIAANGVNVSTTCTDLQNTGVRNEIGSVIQIKQLHANEGYCFAVAGFDINEIQSKKVGETSNSYVTLQPMPINQLYAYLAKQAYWVGDYETASLAAKKNIEFFVEESEIFDRFLDQKNQIILLRIKQKIFKEVSNVEISSFAESLFIRSKCIKTNDNKEKIFQRHKILCQQANLQLLAIEACSVSQLFVLGKRVLLNLYNSIGEIIRIKSRYLFQGLVKMYIFLQDIPKQYWDSGLRQFSAKLIYEISTLCFQYNQINLGKMVIYQSNQIPNRKYKMNPKVIEVAEEQAQAKGGPAKGAQKQQVAQGQDEVKMVQKVVYNLSDQPTYQDYLEDALLNFTEEYGDFVAGFLDNCKEQLDYYSQFIENGAEQIEQIKNQLSLKWNFWETLKEPQNALQKMQVQFKNHPSYLEMLCKFARKQIESNNLKLAKEILAQAEQVNCESVQILYKIFQLQFQCAQKDIAWVPENLEVLKSEKESNGEIENQTIDIFTEYYQIIQGLNKDTYQTLWKAEFYYLKALTTYLDKQMTIKQTTPDVYFEMDRLDLEKVIDQNKIVKELNQKNLSQNDIDFFKEQQSLLALAAYYASESDAEFQLKNIVKFAQNICIREQMNPFDLRGNESNLYSFLIGESMLKIFKKQCQPQQNLTQQLTKDFWYNKAEIQPYADFASFIINALFIEEKNSVLSNFCKNFCNITQHGYSNIVIPFIIKSYTILEDRAKQLTQEKINLLNQKTEDFEQWKNGKRRKNRAAQLTNEIPPEEQQYNQDKEIITHQINILKKKQNSITDKKQLSQTILEEIKRDANQAQLQLFECKRSLEKFAETLKITFPDQAKQQKKSNQMMFDHLRKSYKQVIEMLIKRKDTLGLIRAYSQQGDLLCANGNIAEAQENWNDALDSIFQKIHSLKNQDKVNYDIGERQCLSACVFLYKLAKYCYFDNMQIQKEAYQMSATLSFQVYKTQMVNPQTLISFADTRNILLPIDLFNQNLEPIITMQASDFLIQGLIDNEMHLQALPLIQIMDYIACKICFSDFYSTRAKLFKSIVLSKSGMINQSFQMLQQVQNEKCGPIPLLQQNENLNLQKGNNWFSQIKEYSNNLPYFQDQNKEVIEIIQKLDLLQNFDQKQSQLNNFQYQYARIQLLFSIHEQEIIERPELADQRINMIKYLENKLRELLVQIQKSDDTQQNDIVAQGPLSQQEAKEDRLQLIYRCRYLLANLSLAIGQSTRSYFILKTGLDVIQNHVFELPNAELGREAENEDQQVQNSIKDAKDIKKAPKADVKDLKKGVKSVVEEKVVEEKKFEYDYSTLSTKTKRRHSNGFWYIKYKISIAWIFYQQNRFENCLQLLKQIKKDCEVINDKYNNLITDEIEGRVYIKQGKIKEGIVKLKECASLFTYQDTNLGRLCGDLAEILFEQNLYEEAYLYFKNSYNIFSNYKKDLRYEQLQPINKKAELENVMQNDKYLFPVDVMEQLSKKESKIRKDDKKGGKDAPKKDAKGKAASDAQEMKVQQINPLQQQDLIQIQKPSLKPIKFDESQSLSIYFKYLEDFVRSTLRLSKCELFMNKLGNLVSYFDKIECFIVGNYNLIYSFKLELYYLQGITYKRMFEQELKKFYTLDQNDLQKNKKFQKVLSRLPYRDLSRNKSILDLPNFSHYLKETLIPLYLDKSKKAFVNARDIMKGECIYFEGNIKTEQILMEMAELILYQREYMPRLGYKYIEFYEDEKLQQLEKTELLNKLNFELESFLMIYYSIQISQCRKEILQTSLSTVNIIDPTKVPADLVNELLEADFIYKKKYDSLLFDESKNKKTSIATIDLISLLNKISRESKIMTFNGNKCQKTILKVHRFIKQFHNIYNSKCMLASIDIQLKQDISVGFIDDGQFKFKSIYSEQDKEYKFIYILSRYNKKNIVCKLSKDEIDKILVGEDKEVLYGNFYISSQELSDLEIKTQNLKQKLQESDLKEKTVKERDYKKLNNNFLEIFDILGKIFNKKIQQKKKQNTNNEYDIKTDKYIDFVPQLSIQAVEYFVKMFGSEGVQDENHNLLVLFRNYHKNKYR